ncbi:IclR family transcriptional regulator [Novosphingobium sp. KACC 22771]|uniref:IclR family transcriptional regulator n=1 Tax=Novosphingobium sp. KACC 22771 TaxID=3025670 RepID=UPI002365DAF1|nr:IclR family transcriptional regulator [Novosphingobium sp. KACC 22771]WDF73960.1 IclR family transcriptional regulator [Novosphingobium sp. KACC 22771]
MADDETNETAPEDKGADSNTVKGAQTLMRALDILDEVIDGPIRAVDLARKLGMNRTTAHRLAHALRTRDYLAVTPDGFALGPKLLQLGVLASEQTDYVRIARPRMEALSTQTGFCVFIGNREGNWSRHLDRVTGRQRLRVATAPGDRRPIAETGLGKALMLDDSEASWKKLWKQAHADSGTEADLDDFLNRMRAYKDEGLVRHDSELGDGVRSIAAPVRNARGAICVAISIASAAHYLTDDIAAELADKVKQCADDVSAAIGWRV